MTRLGTWSRRSLLGGAGLAAAGLALPGCGRAAGGAASGSVRAPGVPRNIVLMIADGMSLGVPSLAEPFSRIVRGRPTCWHGLLRDPRARHSLGSTDSLSGLVTDSSAASTALSSGQRCRNGALNWLGEGQTLTPLADRVIPHGVRIGLVTTDEVCGATPAGFAAVAQKRSDDKTIAPQFRERVDVLLGGGRGAFDPLLRDDGVDLLGEYATRGHRLLLERDDVLRAPEPAKRVLGLFAPGKLPYTIDHRHDQADRDKVPTLAEMTRYALRALTADRRPFFLMVEGARIDHACHGNDAPGLLWDQLAFDDAVGEVARWSRDRDDTLVIITSDHGNANPGLNGTGSGYGETDAALAKLAGATASLSATRRALGRLDPADPAAVQTLVRQNLGFTPTADEAMAMHAACDDDAANDPHELANQQRHAPGLCGQVVGNHTGVTFMSAHHTQDLVLCTALGPGADSIAPLHHHTDLAELMLGHLTRSARRA